MGVRGEPAGGRVVRLGLDVHRSGHRSAPAARAAHLRDRHDPGRRPGGRRRDGSGRLLRRPAPVPRLHRRRPHGHSRRDTAVRGGGPRGHGLSGRGAGPGPEAGGDRAPHPLPPPLDGRDSRRSRVQVPTPRGPLRSGGPPGDAHRDERSGGGLARRRLRPLGRGRGPRRGGGRGDPPPPAGRHGRARPRTVAA